MSKTVSSKVNSEKIAKPKVRKSKKAASTAVLERSWMKPPSFAPKKGYGNVPINAPGSVTTPANAYLKKQRQSISPNMIRKIIHYETNIRKRSIGQLSKMGYHKYRLISAVLFLLNVVDLLL